VDVSSILGNLVAIQACANLLASLWGMAENEVAVQPGREFVRFDTGSGAAKSVILYKDGRIEVWPDVNLNEIKTLFEQVAGLIIQQKVRQAVAAQYQILEEQTAPNGALVLSIEL
jgi:hypothetical protein